MSDVEVDTQSPSGTQPGDIQPPSEGEPSIHRARSSRFRSRSHRLYEACSSLNISDIQATAFFGGRSSEFMNLAIDFFELETFTCGNYVMREGEIGDKLFFLHHGEVEVLVGTQERKVATLGPGSIFGEMALLGAPKRTATIKATAFCDCRVLDKHIFHRLLRKFPEEKLAFEHMAKTRMEELQKLKEGWIHLRRVSLGDTRGIQRFKRSRLQEAQHKFLALRRTSAPAKIGCTLPSLSDDVESQKENELAMLGSPTSTKLLSSLSPRILTDPMLPEVVDLIEFSAKVHTEPALPTVADLCSGDDQSDVEEEREDLKARSQMKAMASNSRPISRKVEIGPSHLTGALPLIASAFLLGGDSCAKAALARCTDDKDSVFSGSTCVSRRTTSKSSCASGDTSMNSTGEKRYTRCSIPSSRSSSKGTPTVLPEGWAAFRDGEGRTYFGNSATGESSWSPPEGLHKKKPADFDAPTSLATPRSRVNAPEDRALPNALDHKELLYKLVACPAFV